MQTEHILALLIEERNKLDRAIEALQGPTKRRGRPPGKTSKAAQADYSDPTMPDWVKPKSALAKTAPKKKRRKFSAAQREAASERMRLRWAAKKKAEVTGTQKAAGKAKKTTKRRKPGSKSMAV